MKKRMNHLRIALIVATTLSLFHAVVISIFDFWTLRNVYLLVYFFFFNSTFLTLNALIFSKKRRYLPERLRAGIRIYFIIFFCLLFIFSLVTFLRTDQIVQIQTLIFLSGMNPLYVTLLTLTIISVIVGAFTILVKKKTNVRDSRKKDLKKIKLFFYTSLIFFILTFISNFYFLNIGDSIITDLDKLIEYESEDLVLEKLLDIREDFDRPNVVFVLLESISAERLALYGYERNVSPNIDELADKSVVFTNAYTTATHSDYAQPGLLSSRYLFTSEVRNTFDQNSPRKFIWDVFKEDNYITGYFSSQDDRWQGMNQYLRTKNLDVYSYSRTDGLTDYGFGLAEKDYDHKTSKKAINWLNKTIKQENPFFLYLNFQATHSPNAYPSEYSHFKPDDPSLFSFSNSEEINRYDNSLRYVDDQIGKIIRYLKENNLTNNTIILITSDHGHDLGDRHGLPGHGYSVYEEELIVPAILYLPNIEPQKIDDKVSHIDFVPTLIDLLGHRAPSEFQGDVMKKDRPIYFVTQSHRYQVGLIDGDIKVIADINKKLVEVYNLTNDPGEKRNINSKIYKGKVLKLLFWHYCQIRYYEKEKWKTGNLDRCSINNNFKSSLPGVELSPFWFLT